MLHTRLTTIQAAFLVAGLVATENHAQTVDAREKQSRLPEFIRALDALGGQAAVESARTFHFRVTYLYEGKAQAGFIVDQAVDSNGNIKLKRTPTSEAPTPSTRASGSEDRRHRATSRPEESYLYNPAAALMQILALKGLAAEPFSVPDPITGALRGGIRISQTVEPIWSLPVQAWFFSKETGLPDEIIVYAPNALGGQLVIDKVIVYRDFAEVRGVKFPRLITNRIRSGQLLTISLDELSQGAVTK